MRGGRKLFRYSGLDAYPALSAAGNFGLILISALFFDSLPLWALGLMFAAIAFCYCWNLQSISHNFIHNAFFGPQWLNRAFAFLETLDLGVPHTIVRHQHWNHHSGDNDARGPDGTTRDWVSSYRFGKDGKPEACWRYCLLSHFRLPVGTIVGIIFREARARKLQFLAECLLLAAFGAGLVLLNWRYFVFFYLPCYYAGWILVYAHNYFLHYGAEPGNKYANSVSSYHRLYNWVFFNNSYHQEHHSRPKAHWTRMKDVRAQIQPQMMANNTRIIRGPHATILMETWLERRRAGKLALDARTYRSSV